MALYVFSKLAILNFCKFQTDVQHFRLSAINCFWLIAPLVNAMPSPPPPTTGNPQNTLWCPWNSSAMKAYLLKVRGGFSVFFIKFFPQVVADNLSINNNNVTDGIAAHYEQLLGYQPFLNLVLTCTDGEDIKQLLDSLLNHIEDIIKRVKKVFIIYKLNEIILDLTNIFFRTRSFRTRPASCPSVTHSSSG